MKAYKNINRFNKALAYIVIKTTGTIFISTYIDFNIEKDIVKILKNNQFVENINGWNKGFTTIILKKEGVFIAHNTNNKTQINLTKVENPILTIQEWINYFDRI